MAGLMNYRGGNAGYIQTLGADGSTPVYVPAFTLVDQSGVAVAPLASGGAVVASGPNAAGSVASGNPLAMGAVFRTTQLTFADGQRSELYTTSRGELLTAIGAYNSVVTVANLGSDGVSTSTIALTVRSHAMKYNGNAFDRDRKPNIFSRLTASAATGSPTSVKTTAGDVGTWWGQNGAAITYFQLYNKNGPPVFGTDTPFLTFPIPANSALSPPPGFAGSYFNTGISYGFTTDVAGTTAAAANAVTSFGLTAA